MQWLKWRARGKGLIGAVDFPGEDGIVRTDADVSAKLCRDFRHELTDESWQLLALSERNDIGAPDISRGRVDIDGHLCPGFACRKNQPGEQSQSLRNVR